MPRANEVCKIKITDAGLPYRTEKLLKRETGAYPSMASELAGPEPATLTYAILQQALFSDDQWKAYTAAFLIGRCAFQDDALKNKSINDLEKLLNEEPPSDVAIEAAMSLILKGKEKKGKQLLKQLASSDDPLGDQYKAGFYLAQTGDLSGYPIFVETLNNAIPHYRLLAARHLLAFAPFDGQLIDNIKIDIRAQLLALLSDPDELVRSEIPFYLEELNIPDLYDILKPVAENDPSSTVKNAAQMVLDRN